MNTLNLDTDLINKYQWLYQYYLRVDTLESLWIMKFFLLNIKDKEKLEERLKIYEEDLEKLEI